jgi:outer membrane protein OmpA-like peptidoglycan-associated protein
MSRLLLWAGLVAWAACSLSAHAQMASSASPVLSAQLAPPDARIADAVIQRDLGVYEAMQSRLRRLVETGRPLGDYHLAKAQCWLDVSFHEYTRNDRSAFPQAALTESEKLALALETRQNPLPMDTPLVDDAARLRPDLWAQTAALKARPGGRCAQRQVACAEVELVHAGHEFNQQQERHAQPYVQIAETLIAEGTQRAERCERPPPPMPAPVPAPAVQPPVVAPPLPAVQEVLLTVLAVFGFDRDTAADILPASRAQIEALVRTVTDDKLKIASVQLTGHADRLNGSGDPGYNRRLSERRSQTVRDLLVSLGIPAASIDSAARGDEVPVESCEGKFKTQAELEACLLPNRRVEIRVRATR